MTAPPKESAKFVFQGTVKQVKAMGGGKYDVAYSLSMPGGVLVVMSETHEPVLLNPWDSALEMTYSAYRFCKDAASAATSARAATVLARPSAPAA